MMNFNLSIFYFFLLVFCALSTTFPSTNGQNSEPVCIDDLEDFERSNWNLGRGLHAENTDALSDILQQEIESANGIFYFVGPHSDNAILSDLKSDEFPSPTFMYVKYYGYFPSQAYPDNMYVHPPVDPSGGPLKFLPNTPGIQWGEAVIEMDNNPSFAAPFEVAALNLGSGEYFLVDKIIILHEDLGQDFEAIQAKCPPKETTTDTPSTTVPTEPTSTSTSTKSTTSTSTESPSVPFSCHEPGFFSGSDCSTFHVCLFEKAGVFGNLMFHCPSPQVWCQSSWRCEDAQVCPCSS